MPLVSSGRPLGNLREAGLAVLICAVTVIGASAQTFTTLVTFNGANGWDPPAQSLVQGLDGDFYGTTFEGGLYGAGIIFKLTKNGQLVTVHNFCAQSGCTDGLEPAAGLIQAVDGNFYGTTEFGGQGVYPLGTFFSMSPNGAFTTLYSFCSQYNGWYGCLDGSEPEGQLVQGVSGDIYGTTPGGGDNFGGVVFVAAPNGQVSTLYSFCAMLDCADGQGPYAGLTLGWDGRLYGTTIGGGSAFSGTVFRLSPDGKETILYSSCSQHGSSFHRCFNPTGTGTLIQGLDGSFYGTSQGGGLYGSGTAFRLTADGVLNNLHNFNVADGSYTGSVIQASDGNFYGTTKSGGRNGFGTIFKITPEGVFRTIHDFDAPVNCVVDCYANSMLMQATDGNLYGVYSSVGYGYSTIFRVEMGLGPFVQTRPALAKQSGEVDLLGQRFEGATGVSFNGTPASFDVVSDTFIRATVPLGATSGYITVTAADGTLTSNVPFHVIP